MLVPHKADPNYDAEMKRFKDDNSTWGGGLNPFSSLDTPAARIGRRIVAHFGLSPFAGGQINLIAQKLLDAVKGDEGKVQIESARADLVERGILS